MTNVAHGIKAEAQAVTHLQHHGYKIIDQNWKTKWCEIDIVAQKDQTIYFVEVKYRLNDNYGTGLDYITTKKLKQMGRSAEGWVQIHNWIGDYKLGAIEVSGNEFHVTNFIEEI